MGIGTLIVFIAMLLVAAVAAGLLIQSSGSLQSKTLTVGSQAKEQVSNAVEVVSILGKGNGSSSFSYFTAMVRLSPGSSPMNLDSLLLSYSSYNSSATYSYAGANSSYTLGPTGFYVFSEQEVGAVSGRHFFTPPGFINGFGWVNTTLDLDFDGIHEEIIMCQHTAPNNPCTAPYFCSYLYVNVSGSTDDYYIPLLNSSGGIISTAGASAENFANQRTEIGSYGFINTSGANSGGCGIGPGKVTIIAPEVSLQDLDQDLLVDDLVFRDTEAWFRMSENGTYTVPLGVDLSTGPQTLNVNDVITDVNGDEIATVTISGATSTANVIDASVNVTITPTNVNRGVYAAEPVKQSSRFQEGVIVPGDMYRIYIAPVYPLYESESATLRIVPRSGVPVSHKFYAPDVVSARSLTVFP